MTRIPTAALVLLAVFLGACESGLDQRYLDSSLGAPLELPPDLSEYETESSFELPAAFSGDDPDSRNRVPVLANVDSLRLQGSADLYWLSVEEPIDNLYQLIKNFWSSEGFQLVQDEPVIGVMQTEWIYREQGGKEEQGSWFTRLFSSDNLTASQDQFRTRIERDGQGGVRVFITHRGTEYIHVLDTKDKNPLDFNDEDSEWQFRQPEPELEIEMLSRLMVYLGLQKSRVEQQIADAKLFAPRAFMHIDNEEKSPFLILKDAYHIAWNRVYHNLERMNFEIVNSEFKSGLSGEGVIRVNTEVAGIEREAGAFSFFSANNSEARELVLVLSEESHELTRVDIETAKGELDTSTAGHEFLSLLFNQIK